MVLKKVCDICEYDGSGVKTIRLLYPPHDLNANPTLIHPDTDIYSTCTEKLSAWLNGKAIIELT